MRRIWIRLSFAALIAALLTACQGVRRSGARLPEMPPGPFRQLEKVPVPELEVFEPAVPERVELSNGLPVLLMPDESRPVIELQLLLDTGSFEDPPGRTGMASIVAEQVRRGGSAQWSGIELDEKLGFHGAEFDLRTEPDRTVARLKCLPSDFEDLFSIFQQVLFEPTFPAEELEKELDRLRAGIQQRNDDPSQATSREAQRALFGIEHPRVRRLERRDLDGLGVEELAEFHRAHYGSRSALLSVHGAFDREAMLARLEQAWGAWSEQPAAAMDIASETPAPEARQVFLAARDDVNQAQIRIAMEGVRWDHPDYAALSLGSYVLGFGGFSSRMMRVIRTELGLAYTTGAYWQPNLPREGLFWAWCGTRNESVGTAIEAMLNVIQSFLDEGIDPEELEGARQRLLNAAVFQVDTSRKVLRRTVDLEFHGYPWDHHERIDAQLRSLTAEQVLQACRRHLDPQRLMIFVMGDPTQFDRELSNFGPVTAWDVEGMTHVEARPPSPVQQRGRAVADRVLDCHGGGDAWAAVAALAARVVPDEPQSVEDSGPAASSRMLWAHPDFVRYEFMQPDGETAMTFSLKGGWWSLPDGRQEAIPPESADRMLRDMRGSLPLLLMSLARDEFALGSEDENQLELRAADGFELEVSLQDSGLVEEVAASAEERSYRYRYENYTRRSGLMLPMRSTASSAEGSQTSIFQAWEVNPELEAEWFEPPTE